MSCRSLGRRAMAFIGTGTRSTTHCLPQTSPPIANELHAALAFRPDAEEGARRHPSRQRVHLGVHGGAAQLGEFDLFDQVPALEIPLGFGWGYRGHRLMIPRRSSGGSSHQAASRRRQCPTCHIKMPAPVRFEFGSTHSRDEAPTPVGRGLGVAAAGCQRAASMQVIVFKRL